VVQVAFLLRSEKAELIDDYRKKLRNAELKKSGIEAEISALIDIISSLEHMVTTSEIAVFNRSDIHDMDWS
jgi:hypothetical protein